MALNTIFLSIYQHVTINLTIITGVVLKKTNIYL